MKRWIGYALLGLLITCGVGRSRAAGLIIVDEAHWWPGPIPLGPIPPRPIPPPHPIPPWPHPIIPSRPHVFCPLEVKFVKVEAQIKSQVAVTRVEEEFYNPNNSRVEGTFVFPVPSGAQLDKFKMEIDGKPVEAELLAADKARRIYEDIVRKAKDPALLEYCGKDVFKVRIFPLEPRSSRRVTLSYTQLLKSDSGLVSYSLPLNTEKFSAKPIRNVSVKVELESKHPLKSIYSPSHKVEIKRHGAQRAAVGFESENVKPDTDLTLYFGAEKEPIGANLLSHKPEGEDGYFLLLASPGTDVEDKQVVKKDVVFVLDTSGSMAGNKLEQAKKALLFCIENLNEGDAFEVIRFSTEVEPLFDSVVEATRRNRDKANKFVEELKPMGGTAIDEALRQSFRVGRERKADERPFVIIFLTDGRPTIGTTDEGEILTGVKRVNDGKNRVFCFGIGTDVNTHLLDKITAETRGFSQYVLPEEDLEVKVSSFYAKIKEPVLANPKLRFAEGLRVTSMYPSPLPDLFRGEQLVLVGRYKGKGDTAITIEGTINGTRRSFTEEGTFANDETEHSFIPRLWATRRVGYLLDEIRLHGENPELRDEVTGLAREYGIVTPYTAYLIVEDEARRDVPTSLRSLQEFERDVEARREAANLFRQSQTERGGMGGVARARYGLGLKSADAAAPAATASAIESYRAMGPSASAGGIDMGSLQVATNTAAGRLANYAQQNTVLAGKGFYFNQNQWMDTEVQEAKNVKRVRVQFASPEYFKLANTEPKVLPWLALGQNVQFVLKETVYEIHE